MLSDEDLRGLMKKIARDWQIPARGGNILTDDKAPVELLGMRALDKIIQRELQNLDTDAAFKFLKTLL